jgi:imidazolonepropionase-like amidohydrolase
MPSSGMISDAHMGIGGDTHMALIVDGGELGKTPEYSILMCLKATRKLMMSGADHVKICTSGGVLSPTDKLTGSQFTVPEIRAVCDTVRMMVSSRDESWH